MRLPTLFFALLVLHLRQPCNLAAEACTAIVAGSLSTTDGSTYAASSADCSECDFRLAKVPSRKYPTPTTRPVYQYRMHYPHHVSDRAATWSPSNLEGTRRQRASWPPSRAIGRIRQVARTNALYEGGAGYALLNEYGVSIGETTCPAKFFARPRGSGGDALFDVGELTKVALERTATAREAIVMMGQLAEQEGYYGPMFDTKDKFVEAGESLMVADRTEAWVFHILPDDTGRSAIWAAQRVPDTDITVVANNFRIRKIDTNDTSTFMHSSNMHEIARRNGFWDLERDGPHLDFSKVFGKQRTPPQSSYTNVRVWRVYTLANPDLVKTLDPLPNDWLDGYPFSVTPKKKLSRDDMFRIYRDHFEGSPYDLTTSDAGGPYGDPDRYGLGMLAFNNLTHGRAVSGEFGRAISLFRTSYTSIARSKASLPKEVGSLLYYSQQQPSSSAFVPLYISLKEVPKAFTRGSLFRYSANESMFWAVAAVSNWVHRYYLHAISDLRAIQANLESYNIDEMDEFARKMFQTGNIKGTRRALEKFSYGIADKVHNEYLALFPKLMARFHDGYVMADEEAPKVIMKSMFYPEWWLKQVGYFSARETGGSYGGVYEPERPPKQHTRQTDALLHRKSWEPVVFFVGFVLGALCSVALVHCSSRFIKPPERHGYVAIR